MAIFETLNDVKTAVDKLASYANADDLVRSAYASDIIDKLIGSEWELDGILLVVLSTRKHTSSDAVWKFYQNIVQLSTVKADAALIVADACSPVVSPMDDSKYHVIRLIYLAANELVLKKFDGHSNVTLACAQVLARIGEKEQAAFFLHNLATILLNSEEQKRESVYIANNIALLEEFTRDRNMRLKDAAELVIERSGV